MKSFAFLPCALFLVFFLCLTASIHAAGLEASERQEGDQFGAYVSLSGSTGLVGCHTLYRPGFVCMFRNLDTAEGTVTESVKLIASDYTALSYFGEDVSLSGNIGLVRSLGAVYVFRDLETATETVTEDVILTRPVGVSATGFGIAVSLSGSIGLVGSVFETSISNMGAAYVFRDLDTATGTPAHNVRLVASDGAAFDAFGSSVSLSGGTGLVAAIWDTVGSNERQGSAYVFRDLDTAMNTTAENAKLTASDGAKADYFGGSMSLSGSIGLIGAAPLLSQNRPGSAYVFRNLDTATGNITQNAKLTASDGVVNNNFGAAVGLSGGTGLVGATFDDVDSHSAQGSAYLFRNLNTVTGTVTEAVKLIASDGMEEDRFGGPVSLDGDNFLIGTARKDSSRGKAYSGSVSSVTTLDAGDTDRILSGISFKSREDWIVGKTTDSNSVTLSEGDSATVTASGKAVYIGKNAGSDHNTLIVAGQLSATTVYIGSTAGNTDNCLQIEAGAGGDALGGEVDAGLIRLAPGNCIAYEGDFTENAESLSTLLGYLDPLEIWNGSQWIRVDDENNTLLNITFQDGYTVITALEPPPAPVISSVVTASGKVGAALTYQIVASNSPTSYSASSLPTGLTINKTTGKITGKPTKAGTFNTTVKAANVGGVGTKAVKFTIAKETTKPVITVTTPKTLAATVKTTSYTVKGKATDNISPVKVQYRIDPPGTAKYGSYKSIALSGTATSKTWSYKLATKTKGAWKVQFRALDAAGNISTVKTVTITRK